MIKYILISATLVICANMYAQSDSSIDSTNVQVDSLSQEEDAYGIFKMFSGNPGKAALYSLVVPSAGQFYNKRYWKVPLALAAEGAAIYNLIDNFNTFKQWDEEWKCAVNGQPQKLTTITNVNTLKGIRDRARKRKDDAWLILIGVHLLITADAFIDRHLIEFDVSEDLSLQLNSTYPGLSLAYQF